MCTRACNGHIDVLVDVLLMAFSLIFDASEVSANHTSVALMDSTCLVCLNVFAT